MSLGSAFHNFHTLVFYSFFYSVHLCMLLCIVLCCLSVLLGSQYYVVQIAGEGLTRGRAGKRESGAREGRIDEGMPVPRVFKSFSRRNP